MVACQAAGLGDSSEAVYGLTVPIWSPRLEHNVSRAACGVGRHHLSSRTNCLVLLAPYQQTNPFGKLA